MMHFNDIINNNGFIDWKTIKTILHDVDISDYQNIYNSVDNIKDILYLFDTNDENYRLLILSTIFSSQEVIHKGVYIIRKYFMNEDILKREKIIYIIKKILYLNNCSETDDIDHEIISWSLSGLATIEDILLVYRSHKNNFNSNIDEVITHTAESNNCMTKKYKVFTDKEKLEYTINNKVLQLNDKGYLDDDLDLILIIVMNYTSNDTNKLILGLNDEIEGNKNNISFIIKDINDIGNLNQYNDKNIIVTGDTFTYKNRYNILKEAINNKRNIYYLYSDIQNNETITDSDMKQYLNMDFPTECEYSKMFQII